MCYSPRALQGNGFNPKYLLKDPEECIQSASFRFTMTIDPKSGDVRIGEVCFGSELMENDFLNWNIGRSGKLVPSTADYHWCEIWVLDPNGREAGITLRFTAGEKLQQIRLKMVKPDFHEISIAFGCCFRIVGFPAISPRRRPEEGSRARNVSMLVTRKFQCSAHWKQRQASNAQGLRSVSGTTNSDLSSVISSESVILTAPFAYGPVTRHITSPGCGYSESHQRCAAVKQGILPMME